MKTPSPRTFVLTWLVLLVLTGTTFAIAHVQLGPFNTPIAILIAVAKATLIALFFMHLVHEGFAQRFILVGSALFVLLLMLVVLMDATTRFPLTAPPDSTRHAAPTTDQLG